MGKPIIAFDLDDVLADSTAFWHLEVNRRTGVDLSPDDWKVPDEYSGYYTRLWQNHGIDHLFSVEDIDAHMETDQSGILAIPEAHAVLVKLKENHELVVVTARAPAQEKETRRWLDGVYPGIFERIFFTKNEGNYRNKGYICNDIGAEWLVDDSPAHCHDALEHGVKAILYGEYGWHVEVSPKVVRCKTWKDIGTVLHGK